jgi:hypothetical protein
VPYQPHKFKDLKTAGAAASENLARPQKNEAPPGGLP